MVREYYGVIIHRNETVGYRPPWWAFGPTRMLAADTLDGMREAIREDRRKAGLPVRKTRWER